MTAEALRANGYDVHEAWSFESARRLLPSIRPRLVIMALPMSEQCASLIEELPKSTGAIIVSADETTAERIRCLEAGALDYMIKPIDYRELVLRVRNLTGFARGEAQPTSSFDLGPIRIDLLTRVLTSTADGHTCRLTNVEFTLMIAFLKAGGSILTRHMLCDLMKYSQDDMNSRSIDVLVSKLRRKLRDIGQARLLWSVRGEGYRLRAEALSIPSELFDNSIKR